MSKMIDGQEQTTARPLAEQAEATDSALNRVAKWRSILTGRMVGTVPRGDPQGEGFRDLFEKFILLRVDTTALTTVMLRKGLINEMELMQAVEAEAEALSKDYERRFPGMVATDDGISISMPEARDTFKGFPP